MYKLYCISLLLKESATSSTLNLLYPKVDISYFGSLLYKTAFTKAASYYQPVTKSRFRLVRASCRFCLIIATRLVMQTLRFAQGPALAHAFFAQPKFERLNLVLSWIQVMTDIFLCRERN